MHILISGASGFIGKALIDLLLQQGHTITAVSRDARNSKSVLPEIEVVDWTHLVLKEHLAKTDVVINLAGESISSGKWTAKKKTSIVNSRMLAAQRLMEAMQNLEKRPKLFMQASAIGIYGDRGEENCLELTSPGSGFLAEVCVKWESHIKQLQKMVDKVVTLRIGLVLGVEGGMMPELIKLNKKHLAGTLGKGNQWLSWIHIYDLIHAIVNLMDNDEAKGPYNLVGPKPVRQKEFSRLLADQSGIKPQLPAPAFMIRLMMGEMGKELLLSGQKVSSSKLVNQGFVFKYNTAGDAIGEVV